MTPKQTAEQIPPKRCKTHKPKALGYIQDMNDAERRMKKGQKQKQCPICKLWFWMDEYYPFGSDFERTKKN